MSGPVMLKPGGNASERFLGYGATGSGKTNAWFNIALHTTGHFYVLDTDLTVLDFLEGERFSHLEDRITWVYPESMEEAIEHLEEWMQKATPMEDWIVTDRIDWAWDEAQSEWSENVYGRSIDEHYLLYRQEIEEQKKKDPEKRAGNPFDGFTDWGPIKKRHQRITKALMKTTSRKVHWFACASEQEVNEKFEKDATIIRDYGRIGARPAGEKKNGHIARSVIRFMGNNPATWRVTTVKDRERKQLDGQGISDFALDYLVGVGNWVPKSAGG